MQNCAQMSVVPAAPGCTSGQQTHSDIGSRANSTCWNRVARRPRWAFHPTCISLFACSARAEASHAAVWHRTTRITRAKAVQGRWVGHCGHIKRAATSPHLARVLICVGIFKSTSPLQREVGCGCSPGGVLVLKIRPKTRTSHRECRRGQRHGTSTPAHRALRGLHAITITITMHTTAQTRPHRRVRPSCTCRLYRVRLAHSSTNGMACCHSSTLGCAVAVASLPGPRLRAAVPTA
jgi:hypothetical protein